MGCRGRVEPATGKALPPDRALLATRNQGRTPYVWALVPPGGCLDCVGGSPGPLGRCRLPTTPLPRKPSHCASGLPGQTAFSLPETDPGPATAGCGATVVAGTAGARSKGVRLDSAPGGAPWTKRAAVQAAEASARAWTTWTSRPTAASSW